MTITLSNKNEEFFKNVDRKFRAHIINSIIGKSIMSGNVFSELEIFLSNDEMEDLINNTNIQTIQIQKKNQNKIRTDIKKEILSRKKKDDDLESIFIGFD